MALTAQSRIARLAVATAAALVMAAALPGCGSARDQARPGPEARIPAAALQRSIAAAYSFLRQMTDRYAAGSTPRLVRSYTGGAFGRRFTVSVTYDDAVLVDADLAGATAAERSQAAVVGNGLLYVQAHDPRHDGRVRAAYAPTPLRSPRDVTVTDPASSTGSMAWVGQALVQLYAATGTKAYLTGAEAIGNWVQVHCHDARGLGGYTGGETAGGQKIEWKSTEHNIDLYGLFSLLAKETRNPVWAARAAWARRFVVGMWDAPLGRFDVGTTTDGVTVNPSLSPEDVNSWSYLALRDPAYAASVTWDVRQLAVFDDGFRGVSFCEDDRSGVWFEGTAHLADALEFRGDPGDSAQAARYLANIDYAQSHAPHQDGRGVPAASEDGLSDCSGGTYYASLHTGATAWYILAAQKVDPFFLISGSRPR